MYGGGSTGPAAQGRADVSSLRTRARSAARHVALDGLSAWTRLRPPESPPAPLVQFVYLHAVPPRDLDSFARLVARLATTHEIVSYGEGVRRVDAGGASAAAIAFSFDDGFASNVAAAEILEQQGATACFFVPVGFVGCPDVAAARAFFGMRDGVDEAAMTWRDLEGLVERGHEVGNHTVTHRVLSSLPDDEVSEEIGRAREVLSSRLGQGEHFAWPRGRFQHFTPAAARATFASGHVSCASAERGAHLSGHGGGASLCVRRDHLVARWPLRHQLHFVRASAGRPVHAWPEGWQVG